MGNAVVVFSGGQDSTTCLFWALETFEHVETVTFNYGQRNVEEVKNAQEIAEVLGVKNTVIDATVLNDLTFNAMTDHTMEIDQQGGNVPNTFVPGRNHVFLSLAAIYAQSIGAHHIITGVSEADSSGYPDCRNEFIKEFGKTISLAMDYPMYVLTPLMYLSKAETWALADKLGKFEFIKNNTITCYNGIPGVGCGECPACKLRNRGYNEYIKLTGGRN